LQEIRTYGLDRISKISMNLEIQYRESGFDPEDYFRYTIGISGTYQEPEKIILKFTKFQSKYVITQPIHESQEIVEETETHVLVSLFVSPTYELISRILGWGTEVEVVEPEGLRERVISIIAEMSDLY